jgi:ABC-type phosphate/phosphonate transport system permease subunit
MVCNIDDILFFSRTWKNMNDMFDLFWTSSNKLDFMPSWRNANSITPKWNYLNILFLEMAFAWIFIRSKNLWIGLP